MVFEGYANAPHFIMMTSSNGSIFRGTGPLWGESTGNRWIPPTKASGAEFWCFRWSAPEGWANNRDAGDLRHHRAHSDGTVMILMLTAAQEVYSVQIENWLLNNPWWRHQMETFSALLAGHRWIPCTKASDAELWWFLQRLNKQLSKKWWGWWFETPSRSLWRHCNVACYLDSNQETTSTICGLEAPCGDIKLGQHCLR